MLQRQFEIHFKVEEYLIILLVMALMMIHKTNKLFYKNYINPTIQETR